MSTRSDRLKDGRRFPYARVENAAFAYMSRVGATAWAVYTYIIYRAGEKDCAWPSYSTIQQACGIKDRSTVSRALQKLEEARLLKIEREPNHNVYVLLPVEEVAEEPAEAPREVVGLSDQPVGISDQEPVGYADRAVGLSDQSENQTSRIIRPQVVGLSDSNKIQEQNSVKHPTGGAARPAPAKPTQITKAGAVPSEQQRWFEVVRRAIRADADTLPKSLRAQIGKYASELAGSGARLEDADAVIALFHKDMHYKTKLNAREFADFWPQAITALRAKSGAPAGGDVLDRIRSRYGKRSA